MLATDQTSNNVAAGPSFLHLWEHQEQFHGLASALIGSEAVLLKMKMVFISSELGVTAAVSVDEVLQVSTKEDRNSACQPVGSQMTRNGQN